MLIYNKKNIIMIQRRIHKSLNNVKHKINFNFINIRLIAKYQSIFIACIFKKKLTIYFSS